MDFKKTALIATLIMLVGLGSAAVEPAVRVFEPDGNYAYPNVGTTYAIQWLLTDANHTVANFDMNVWVYYMNLENMTRVELTTDTPGTNDHNISNYCATRISHDTNQICSYSWSIPVGLDGNFAFDVNVLDINTSDTTSTDDRNYITTSTLFIDTNSCVTSLSELAGLITLDVNCTGRENLGGTAGMSYSDTRNRTCADNFRTYTTPFQTTFGEHTICYRSIDDLGNIETAQSFLFVEGESTFNMILLVELLLAALILITIASSFIIDGVELSSPVMIALLTMAVILLMSIFIIASII